MTEVSTVYLPPAEPSLDNGTKYNETDFKTDNLTAVIIDSVTLLLCLFGLLGNGIVLWLLGFHIKRNPFTMYILNLAAADFGCLFCLAVFLTIYTVINLFSLSLEVVYSMKYLTCWFCSCTAPAYIS